MSGRRAAALALATLGVLFALALLPEPSPPREGDALASPVAPARDDDPADRTLPEASHPAEAQALEADPPAPGATPHDVSAGARDEAGSGTTAQRDLVVAGRVVDELGGPLPGAEVWFHPSQAACELAGLPDVDDAEPVPWSRLPHAVADDEGRFALAVPGPLVDPPSWPVVAEAVHSSQLVRHAVLVLSHPGRRATAAALHGLQKDVRAALETRAPPADGERPRHEAGDVVLGPAAVVTARVVDAHGRPLPGARLSLGRPRRHDAAPPDWRLVAELTAAIADARGSVRADRCPEGEFPLLFEQEGFEPRTTTHELVAGATADLGDVALDAGHALHGLVVDGEGRPIEGATVKAVTSLWIDPEENPHGAWLELRRYHDGEIVRQTGADGAFAFDTLSDDESQHGLVVGADGWEPLLVTDVALDGPPVIAALQPAALLVLTVVDAASGEPVAGAEAHVVRLVEPSLPDGDDDDVIATPLELLVGPPAAAHLGRDDPGDGLLVAFPAGAQGQHVVAWAPGYGEARAFLPGVVPGARLEHELRLPRPARVLGRVVAPGGAPLQDVEVDAVRDETRLRPERKATTLTDADGRFAVDGLSAGSWIVFADRDDLLGGLGYDVELTDGEERDGLEIVIESGANVAGILLDSEGRPAIFHEVSTRLFDPHATGFVGSVRRTDEHGRFVFKGLPPGATRIAAFPAAEAVRDLVAGDNPDLELRLGLPARVRGQLIGADHLPVPGATVTLHREGSWRVHETRTGEDGGFLFDDIAQGEFVARATVKKGVASTVAVVTPTWGAEAWAELRLGSGVVAALLRDEESGEPLAGKPVAVEDDPETVHAALSSRLHRVLVDTDEDGRFTASDLPPGRYRVRILDGSWEVIGEPLVVQDARLEAEVVARRRGPEIVIETN